MENKNNIQSPGLRKKRFGSKAFLRNVQKRIKGNISKPKKLAVE